MSKSRAVEAAIADIAAGLTWRAAAIKNGVQRSSISRAIKKKANPPVKMQDVILACQLAEQQRDQLLAAIVPLLDGYIEWVQDAQMGSGLGDVTREKVLSDCEPAKNAAAVIADVLLKMQANKC